MNKILRRFLSGVAVSVMALAAPAIDTKFNFSQAKPGSELTITGSGFPSSATGIVLTIQPGSKLVPAKSATPTALVFSALPALDPGDYKATVTFPAEGATPAPAPVSLDGILTVPKPPPAQTSPQIPAPTEAAPKITFIAPPTAYGNDKDLFAFDIYGENFPSPTAEPYVLSISSITIEPIELKTNQACSVNSPCLNWIGPEHIAISGIKRADNYQWTTPVDLRINGKWVGPKTLIFSRWQRHWPFLAAGAVVVLSFLIIMGAFRLKSAVAGASKHDVITLFLLDADTNTYSLSKFQVFSWLTIIVFAYVYVLFCGITIQGVMKWPEFPGTLAGMFGLSLGSAVASSAVTEAKGNKGAGVKGPSFADFFSSGGVVAADRFQFFLWTLVGFAGYLSLLWFSDPTNIKEVPTVPEGLLYLMGISSGGYIGGKLARKPGPNITGLKASVDFTASRLTLRIVGDNLSPAGTYQIEGKDVHTVVSPVRIISQAQGATGFATELEVVITTLDPTWIALGQPRTLRLINDDGQFADRDYTVGISVAGTVTKTAAGGGAAITIPTLALAPGIGAVDLEVHDSAGAAFKQHVVAPLAPPPTVVTFPGADPAGPATLLITVSDGSSGTVTIP